MIAADEALKIGLIDWAVPEEKINRSVDSIVAGVLKGSAAARGYSKRLVTASFESSFEDAFRKYQEYQEECLRSADHKSAMAEYRSRKR
jgi:enoyl-CoA hydratase/carnithine racemase